MKINVINGKNYNRMYELDIYPKLLEPINKILLKEVIEWQFSNRRSATYWTKTPADLSFSGKKLAAQKGRGAARIGGRGESPAHRKGYTCFGPNGRTYDYVIPKKKIKKALSIILSEKFRLGDVIVLDNFYFDQISTVNFLSLVKSLDIKSGLFVDVKFNRELFLSLRNVYGCDFLPMVGLNVLSVMKRQKLIISESAFNLLETRI